MIHVAQDKSYWRDPINLEDATFSKTFVVVHGFIGFSSFGFFTQQLTVASIGGAPSGVTFPHGMGGAASAVLQGPPTNDAACIVPVPVK